MVFYDEFNGNPLAAYTAGVDKIKAKARRELGLAVDGAIVRPLRPEDLGMATPWWVLNQVATNTWTDLVTAQTINDNRFCLVNGVYFNGNSQELHQIRVQRAGSFARYWPVTPIRGFKSHTGWCDDPWTVDQNTQLTISAICSSISTLYEIDFIGATAEKRGVLINP